MSWCQTLEVLAQHRCLKLRLSCVSILFLQAHMSACCKTCRNPLWRNLSSEILPCCSELRISLIWALRVSFAAGYLTFEIAETKEPVRLRGKWEHAHWQYCNSITALHVWTEQDSLAWLGQRRVLQEVTLCFQKELEDALTTLLLHR